MSVLWERKCYFWNFLHRCRKRYTIACSDKGNDKPHLCAGMLIKVLHTTLGPDRLSTEFQTFFYVCMNPLIYTTGLINPGEIGNFLDDDLPKKEHFNSSEGNHGNRFDQSKSSLHRVESYRNWLLWRKSIYPKWSSSQPWLQPPSMSFFSVSRVGCPFSVHFEWLVHFAWSSWIWSQIVVVWVRVEETVWTALSKPNRLQLNMEMISLWI